MNKRTRKRRKRGRDTMNIKRRKRAKRRRKNEICRISEITNKWFYQTGMIKL